MGDVFGFIGGVFLGRLRHLLIPFDETVVAEPEDPSPDVLSLHPFEWHPQCVYAFAFFTEGHTFSSAHTKDPVRGPGKGEQQL